MSEHTVMSSGENPPKRRGYSVYLRIIVSIFLFYYVFHKVGWSDFFKTVRGANPVLILLSFAVNPFLILVSAAKWHILSKSQGMKVSLGRLFLLYIVGYLFNNVLPTNVGGDVVRAYELGKYTNKRAEAMASVFMERFTGLTALIFLGFISLALKVSLVEDVMLLISLGIAFIGYVGGTWMVFDPSLLSYIRKKSRWKITDKFLQKLLRVQEAIYIYKDHKKELVYSMILSFVFYFVGLVNVYVSALAFGVSISFVDLMIVVPIILILTMIPVSLGGLGLQEWAYYFMFSKVGVPGAVGLSVALLMRAKSVILGLIGGLIYFFMVKEDYIQVKEKKLEL